jgi:DNA-binding transcriptional LysR family regulator
VHVELRHLRYFVAVAEELNFSRAAERMHVAQPALSAQIRALERQLGCELFSRTTRKVELTPSGQMLLEDAREILARADGAVSKLQAVSRGERGQIRVGFAAHGAGEVGTEVLRRFTDAYPSIATELVNASSLEELQTQLVDRDSDVAFVWLPLLYEELEAERVLTERKYVAMFPGHRLAGLADVHEADLADEPIVAPWEHFPAAFLATWFGRLRPDGRRERDLHAISVEESLAFVSTGRAVYCVPESVSRFYPRPDVVFRPIVDSNPVQVAVAWHAQNTSPVVLSFVETARAVSAEAIQSVPS